MSSSIDEETLTGLYSQRQEILKQLADVDTSIKLLETQLQERNSVAGRLATEELATGGSTEVDKVKQLIFRCMRDASGLKDALKVTDACRHIQETLQPNDAANRPRLRFRNVFVHEVIAHARELSTDPNGSDFMQHVISLMKNGTVPAHLRELEYNVNPTPEAAVSPVSELMLLIEQLGDHLVPVMCNTNGARVSQKIVECLNTVEEFVALVTAISPTACVELAKDINGNHTLSKIISSSRLRSFGKETQDSETKAAEPLRKIEELLFDPITRNCIGICKSRQGCCIIQKCLQFAPEPYYTTLIDTVLSNSLKLVQDPFGNYVVQFILDRHQDLGANRGVEAVEITSTNYTNQIIRQLLHHVAELSCNKFSSNVVEKCLKTASPDVRQLLVDELTDPQVLPKLLTDGFANYVIQTAIVTASDDAQFTQLRDSIMPLQNLLKNSPYGVKIESKLSRRHRESTRKPARKKESAAAATVVPHTHPTQHGVPLSSSQESFMGAPPAILPGMQQHMTTLIAPDGTAIGGPMAFANLPSDILFHQQQMMNSMPLVFSGQQPVIGVANGQPQFMNMNMNMNTNMNMNMNGVNPQELH